MKKKNILFTILFSILLGWTFFAYSLGSSHITMLKKLRASHFEIQGELELLPVARGSGPKPQADWAYHFEWQEKKYTGYIRAGGPFRIPLGVHSINDLEAKPLHGEKITIIFNPENPEESAPFLVTERHITFARWVMWLSILFGFVICGIGFFLIKAIF